MLALWLTDEPNDLASLWQLVRGLLKKHVDMNRDSIWTVAEKMGLRPLGLVSIDDTWSAFRLRAAQ